MALFMELIRVNGDKEIEVEGQKYKLKNLMPMIYKEMKKTIQANEESAEKILRFLYESYLYITGMSDTFPEFER